MYNKKNYYIYLKYQSQIVHSSNVSKERGPSRQNNMVAAFNTVFLRGYCLSVWWNVNVEPPHKAMIHSSMPKQVES